MLWSSHAPYPYVAPGGGGPVPWLLEDYSTYVSTTDLINDPRVIYSTAEDIATNLISLDQTQGVNAFGFNLTQCMKYAWTDNGNACSDFSIGRNLMFPGCTHANPLATQIQDLWIDCIHKTDSFFKVDFGNTNCAPAYKFLFGRTDVSRFGLGYVFSGDYVLGYPGNEEPADLPLLWTPFDGNWHRYQLHFKLGTGTGVSSLIVDGVTINTQTGLTPTASYIWGVALGRNLNQGPTPPQSNYWGRIALFNTDPGWGI